MTTYRECQTGIPRPPCGGRRSVGGRFPPRRALGLRSPAPHKAGHHSRGARTPCGSPNGWITACTYGQAHRLLGRCPASAGRRAKTARCRAAPIERRPPPRGVEPRRPDVAQPRPMETAPPCAGHGNVAPRFASGDRPSPFSGCPKGIREYLPKTVPSSSL